MSEKESARQRLQLRRARIRFRQESVRKEILAQKREQDKGYYAMGALFVAFEVWVFLVEVGVI